MSQEPQTRPPIALAAFEGWNDAGDAATGVITHLCELWGAEPLVALDPEEYHDFQVNRPQVSITDDGTRRITWPTTRLFRTRPQGYDRDVLLVHGIEPSMRWRRYTDEVLGHLAEQNVETLITLGALLADVPHTRPIPVTSTSDNPELLDRLALQKSTYEGPTGIVGVLGDVATRRGLPVLSLWAAVPHYVGQPPSPKAQLALLSRIEELLGLPVELAELAEDAQAWEHGVDELAGQDEEIAAYVKQLEEAKDTADLPEASGEAIAREFERYLRRRGDQGKPGST
ncbi:MAG: PAC2 family protein [Actinomycetales bacterium]